MSDAAAPAAPVPMLAHALDGPPGAPVLVLGNSLGTSAAVWDQQVARFRATYRLLRYELPGHGGSAATPGPYTIDGLGAGMLALLDSLGVARVGYCGISLGGMIGLWLAAHAPDRVAVLGLVCTSSYLPPAAGWLDRADRVRAHGMTSVAGAVTSRWFTPEYAAMAPAVVDAFRGDFERTDPVGYAACCAAIAGLDQRPALAAITAPTLIIAGADDPATPPEHAEVMAGGISGARLLVIPGTAHLAAVSAPALVGAAIDEHLRAAVAPGGDQCRWR